MTILRITSTGDKTVYSVVTTDGDTTLGGQDLDTALVEHFVYALEKEHGEEVRLNKKIMKGLREACEKVKINLSISEHTSIDFFGGTLNGKPVVLEEQVKREDFERICSPIFDSTMDCVTRACVRALKEEDIDSCEFGFVNVSRPYFN